MKTDPGLAAILATLILASASAPAANESPVFDIPRLDNVAIDGQPGDWGDGGFRVEVLPGESGEISQVENLNAALRLGWNDRGLLVLLTVNDDIPVEDPNLERLWQNDSVELFFATQRGGTDLVQVIFSPGLDPRFPDLRRYVNDSRKSQALKGVNVAVEAARSRTATGYVLEALLPWDSLAVQPVLSREVAFQVYVNDVDGDDYRRKVLWYPRAGAHSDTTLMHRLRLATLPGAPVHAVAAGRYELFRRTVIQVAGGTDLAGQTIRVEHGGAVLATGTMVAAAGRAETELVLPMPPPNHPYGSLTVSLTNGPIASLELPGADGQRARAFMEVELRFPRVFGGEQFPSVEFAQPSLVESLIGRYKVRTTFYDRDCRKVTRAGKPGRYGAVIDITAEDGRVFRRLRTLFRTPEPLNRWEGNASVSLQLPKELGIATAATKEYRTELSENLWHDWVDASERDNQTAALLAAMFDAAAVTRTNGVHCSAAETDRQWWVGMKRALAGMPERKFVCPLPLVGEEARVLREGTPQDAGMKPDAAEKIDAVCRAWAADSDQAFIACVARRGVIVLHRAYGERDGKPMTVDTKSWVASITKLIAATSMMLLVDKGLVGLDDGVDKFLPAFRGVAVERPVTVRHLYTHTAGMWGHWGDDLNDFEEIVAGYYPYLKVGKSYDYNGMSFSLGGKIIETVSGEALPQFYRNHLLGPLGCTNTEIAGSSGDARSTAIDLARIAQMLVNRGKYGQYKFLDEATYRNMLPQRLTGILGADTTTVHGIGTMSFAKDGIGANTYGYGSASMTTLRIDPDKDLVITMTRNAAGRNFGQYHPKFIAAILDGMDPTAGTK